VYQHGVLHLKFTPLRPVTSADLKRADEIVASLRPILQKYTASRLAEHDGFRPFGRPVVGREIHFTNYWNAFRAAFRFEPRRPTSLLYQVTPSGYVLTGALYTVPRSVTWAFHLAAQAGAFESPGHHRWGKPTKGPACKIGFHWPPKAA